MVWRLRCHDIVLCTLYTHAACPGKTLVSYPDRLKFFLQFQNNLGTRQKDITFYCSVPERRLMKLCSAIVHRCDHAHCWIAPVFPHATPIILELFSLPLYPCYIASLVLRYHDIYYITICCTTQLCFYVKRCALNMHN